MGELGRNELGVSQPHRNRDRPRPAGALTPCAVLLCYRRHQHRVILRRCLARIQSAALSRALLTWVDETVERRRLKNVGAKVVLRFRNRLACAVVDTWREQVLRQRRADGIARRCILRVQNGALAMIVQSWTEFTLERRRLKQVGAKVVLRIQNQLAGAVVATWREQVLSRQRADATARRCVAQTSTSTFGRRTGCHLSTSRGSCMWCTAYRRM